jgi:prepilin-type N-terminal cleavage/methylation domain-containing protein/prepilin-type processing-associated H-X9-DG protein
MVCRRRSGFTLIELLVVIAIIAILAAMLFPVFARARESARKIQCLSNVKNIAIAIQMYLSDYDRFPPGEHDAAEIAYFDTTPGGRSYGGDHCNRRYQANPYLRWPVVFDEYTKNRDVWRCPSSKRWIGSAWIVPDYGQGFLKYLQDTEGKWGHNGCDGGGPCSLAWPVGWGGTITDSILQQACATGDTGSFESTIAYPELYDVKTSQMGDPSWTVACGDSCIFVNINGPDNMLYSLCGTGCGKADWANCPDSQECGLDSHLVDQWATDPSFRAKYTRHLGGSNVGFADGHASWFMADALVAASPYCDCECPTQHLIKEGRPIRGLCPTGVGDTLNR